MEGQSIITVTPDRFTRHMLVVLSVLMAIIAVELWVAAPSGTPAAVAQIPDTGLQRQELIVEARRTNELLERIAQHLETKRIKVSLPTDDTKASRPSRVAR